MTAAVDFYLDGLLTPQEVAALYRVSTVTAKSWARNGKLPAIQVPAPGGVWRFSRRAVFDDLASDRANHG